MEKFSINNDKEEKKNCLSKLLCCFIKNKNCDCGNKICDGSLCYRTSFIKKNN